MAAPAGLSAPAGVDPRAAGVLVFGIGCVSTAAIFFELAEAPALVKATWRLVFASLILVPLAMARNRAAIASLGPAQWRRATLAGAALALHFALWVPSLDYTSVASSVVLVTTNPLFVALASPRFLGERVGRALWIGIALAFGGTAVLVLGDAGGAGGLSLGGTPAMALFGDALALGGAVAAAAYFMLGRRLRAKLDLLPYVTVVYTIAAVVLLVACAVLGLPLFGYPAITWLLFLLLALVPQILGHSSFNWALQHLSAAFVAGAVLGEPIGSTLLAWWILDQTPSSTTLLGGALILAGLAVAARGEGRG